MNNFGGVIMFCSKCGSQNVQDSKFCQNCGTALNQTVSSQQAPVEQTPRSEFSPPPPPINNPAGGMGNSNYGPPARTAGMNMGQYPNGGQTNFGQEQVEYAHIGRRFIASLIDGIMLTVIMSGIGAAIGFIIIPKTKAMLEMLTMLMNLIQFALGLFYFSYMESSKNSATFGKMLMGIKVTDMDGNRISLGRGVKRYLAKIPSALILLIGFIMAAFTDKRQALHDKLAGCLVIRKR